jgi:hypothetical protein
MSLDDRQRAVAHLTRAALLEYWVAAAEPPSEGSVVVSANPAAE